MEETPQVHNRVNVESLFEQVIAESQNIDVNKKDVCIVKVGNKFATKNTPENIKNGKPRYVLSDTAFRFYRETDAQEAARTLKGKVEKE